MNIEKVRNKLNNYKGQTLNFRFNGSRNQIEEFTGKIVEIYDYVFVIRPDNSNFLKSFSYSDVLIRKLVVLSC